MPSLHYGRLLHRLPSSGCHHLIWATIKSTWTSDLRPAASSSSEKFSADHTSRIGCTNSRRLEAFSRYIEEGTAWLRMTWIWYRQHIHPKQRTSIKDKILHDLTSFQHVHICPSLKVTLMPSMILDEGEAWCWSHSHQLGGSLALRRPLLSAYYNKYSPGYSRLPADPSDDSWVILVKSVPGAV